MEAGSDSDAARHPLVRVARTTITRFAQDELLRNSFYLMSSSLTMGLLGFAFWIVSARLYTPDQVGLATALISASGIISSIGLSGLNTTLIRFLPSSQARDTETSSGLWTVLVLTAVSAGVYLLLVPHLVPRLSFVRQSLGLSLGFVAMTAFASANMVTDCFFIAFRKAQYNLLLDGVVQGLTKLVLPLFLVGLGAYGIFAASGLAATIALVASIFFMIKAFEYRPRVVVSLRFLREAWRFSAANYASSLLVLVPTLAVPLIVLNARGSSQAGCYYVAFQFANLLGAAVAAVANAFLAEGSQEGADLPALMRRAGKLVALVSLPGGLLMAAAGHWLLLVFGVTYSQHATAAVVVLAATTPAAGLYAWGVTALRITKQLRMLVLVNAVFATVTIGLAFLWTGNGVGWTAAAWLCGNVCSGLLAAAAVTLQTKARRALASLG